MPLLDPLSGMPIDPLLALRRRLVADLTAVLEQLEDAPEASEGTRARGATARALVLDTLAWAEAAPEAPDRRRLIAEINLLYDVTIVGAEYYKLFVRVPTAERPAGRI